MSDPNWQRMYLTAIERHHDNLDAILGVIAVGGDLRGVVLTIVDYLDGMDALGEPEDEFRGLLRRAWLAAGGEPDTFPIRDVVAESMPHRIDCSRPGDCDCEPVESESDDHRLAQVPGGHPVVPLPVHWRMGAHGDPIAVFDNISLHLWPDGSVTWTDDTRAHAATEGVER